MCQHIIRLSIYTRRLFLSYKMLWNKYNVHVASLSFYMFHICDFLFHKTFCFEHFGFDILVLLNTDHAMILMSNVYVWKIYNIHNHTWPCIVLNFFSWGGNSESNIESLIMILFSVYLVSLIPPPSGYLTRLLWSSLKDTCTNNFGKNCGQVWPSMFTFRQ